ncbi:MAG: nucleoside monophosphate kinase [Symploca sp. SIO2E6]|nr:nucleoside monophosphate kinase [Symploca sp. SIO2E6]
MKLVILGGPGAGKSTQAKKLCQQQNIPLVSTGDILREAIASQSDLGLQVQPYVEQGELVPDMLLIEFMRERLVASDTAKGWLLEGYPRTAFQAEELDFLLDELQQKLDWAIYLEVAESIMSDRCIGKLTNLGSQIPQTNSPPDYHPDIVQRRIDLFHERTIPILEYYGYRHRLLTINGNQSPEEVNQEILEKMEN